MTTRRFVFTASALTLGSLAMAAAVTGCGDSTTTAATTTTSERQAAAESPTECPEITGSTTNEFTFINNTPELITLRTEPGWTCKDPRNAGSGFSGVSTPASLNGVQVPAGGSVTRALEVKRSQNWNNRFALSYYAGSDRPQIMPITPTGNVMRFVETGRSSGISKYKGYYVILPDGATSSCQTSFPTSLPGGVQATITFDSKSGACGSKTPEIIFAPK